MTFLEKAANFYLASQDYKQQKSETLGVCGLGIWGYNPSKAGQLRVPKKMFWEDFEIWDRFGPIGDFSISAPMSACVVFVLHERLDVVLKGFSYVLDINLIFIH